MFNALNLYYYFFTASGDDDICMRLVVPVMQGNL